MNFMEDEVASSEHRIPLGDVMSWPLSLSEVARNNYVTLQREFEGSEIYIVNKRTRSRITYEGEEKWRLFRVSDKFRITINGYSLTCGADWEAQWFKESHDHDYQWEIEGVHPGYQRLRLGYRALTFGTDGALKFTYEVDDEDDGQLWILVPEEAGSTYIQNKVSLARIQYKNGQTICSRAGYNSNQVWQLSRLSDGRFLIMTGNRFLTYGGDGSPECDPNPICEPSWDFELVREGYYRMTYGKRVLIVRKDGVLAFTDVDSDHDGQLWTLVSADKCPLLTIQSAYTGGLLAADGPTNIHTGFSEANDNQTWRLVPVNMGDDQYFYLHNFGNGLKLAARTPPSVSGRSRIVAVDEYTKEKGEAEIIDVDDDEDWDKHWQLHANGGYVQFTNRATKSRLSVNEQECCSWVISSARMKRLFIKSSLDGRPLSCDGANVWSIMMKSSDPEDGFFLRDSKNGNFLSFHDSGEIFLSREPVGDGQLWIFETRESDMFRIENKGHRGSAVYVQRSDKTGTALYQSRAEEDDKALFYIEHAAFFGLQGLKVKFLYRACRSDEDIAEGIKPTMPWSNRRVVQHIASGNRIRSRFISTTADESFAVKRAFYSKVGDIWRERDEQLQVVRISIDAVKKNKKLVNWLVNLTNEDVMNSFLQGAMIKNYAKNSSEVLFQDPIPREIYDILDPSSLEKPPQPPPKWKPKTQEHEETLNSDEETDLSGELEQMDIVDLLD